jgi:hypothetical protein
MLRKGLHKDSTASDRVCGCGPKHVAACHNGNDPQATSNDFWTRIDWKDSHEISFLNLYPPTARRVAKETKLVSEKACFPAT